ncbi:MAG: hypothetical protein A2151_05020, partial [Candidatus Muproteobacteria bacterium RBG_16_65_34]
MSAEHPVADAAARERALAPDKSFIVQAPAGSGKTELLTRRYLRLLACVEHPEEIVAITFTRKAANEMRNRVLGALERAAGPRPEGESDAAAWELARAALARDRALRWDILASPERLRIGTIDSFCAALTRQMPLLSRLGAPPAVAKDAEALHREAARALIEKLEADEPLSPAIERLLRHLDNDLPKVETLIAAMLARRDQWMRHLADRGSERLRRERLERALAHVIEDALDDLREAVPAAQVAALLEAARYAAGNLRANGTQSAILACLDLAQLPGASAADCAAWRGLAALLLTDDGAWRRRADVRLGFPAASGARNAGDKARFDAAKAKFAALIDALQAYPEFLARLHAVRALPPPRYDDAQWDVVEALCELLPLAAAELWLVFQGRGEVDFTEVAWGALRALGTRDEPTDLALALDYRIRHLLVDEFQDTSLSQYELLEILTAGWEPGDGRTLFVVGDPMQSIYRFRQAEVGLYLRARRRGIGGVALEPLDLSVNFRSQQGVVDWVNRTFAQVLPLAEDIAAGAVTYAPAVAHHPQRPGAAVTLHPFLGRDDAREAERVLELIRRAQADPAQPTVAILVRSRGHLAEIAPRLKRAGLKFRAVEIEQLGHRSVVQDLLALTRALVHPADRLSWLAVLRAPWCGLTLADLEALAGGDPEAAIRESMENPERCARVSAEGRARLERVRAVLRDCAAQSRRRPLRRLVEGAWLALGGPACVAEPTDLADALVYFELIESLEEGGDLADLGALAERAEQLFALPDVEAPERLQLMTIHKAKGLEFHTVVVPGLGRAPRRNEAPLLMWLERPNPRTHEADLLLAPIRERGRKEEPIFEFLASFDRRKGYYEDGRLLYVAATRAIERLHLLGHVAVGEKDEARVISSPDRNSLLHQLWPVVQGEFEAALAASTAAAAEIAAASNPPPMPLKRLPRTWQLPAPPAAATWTGSEDVIE